MVCGQGMLLVTELGRLPRRGALVTDCGVSWIGEVAAVPQETDQITRLNAALL